MDASQLLQANTEVWREYWPEVEEAWTLGTLNGAAVSLEVWTRALRVCGHDDESLALLASDTHRRLVREHTRLFDDAHHLLTWLSGTNLRLAVITNGASDTQRDALRALGIEQLFGAVLISGEIGIAKPDAGIFRIALEKLQVRPAKVCHVGDSLRVDVAGAKDSGLCAIWLNRHRAIRSAADPQPDHEVRSLLELTRLLDDGARA